MVTGRFAPSPTGVLHVGNLRTALASWLSARAAGGRWIIRMEDVDGPRCSPALGEAQLRDLEALGLVSDRSVLWQSTRSEAYEGALQMLAEAGRLYACQCTRRDLAQLASAPHARDGLRPYPGRCRDRRVTQPVWDALRVQLPEGSVAWTDHVQGPQLDDPAQLTGDPLLVRRDRCFAYHLAVVVDDADQGVTEVVRGDDLRSVTATQLRLQELLERPHPEYAHLGLVTAPDGSRLGKRDGALGLEALRRRGLSPEALVGWLGWSLGCQEAPEPCRAEALVPHFAWEQVPKGPVPLPAAWV